MTLVKFYLILVFELVLHPHRQEISSKHINQKDGLAIDGYDPVSYIEQLKALEGIPDYSTVIGSVRYLFSSKENLELFKENPSKYEPKYGGWCAYAMAIDGSKVKIDPKTFKVIDGKLYLFYNFQLNNTLKKWNKNEDAYLQEADNNWEYLIEN